MTTDEINENRRADNIKAVVYMAILLIIALLIFMSCNTNDGEDYTDEGTVYSDFAIMQPKNDGTVEFIGSEETYVCGFESSVIPTTQKHFVLINFMVEEDISTATQDIYRIVLIGEPEILDRAVESAATESQLDSVKKDPVIEFSPIKMVGEQYLMCACNYDMSLLAQGGKAHYFTLCYAKDKGYVHSSDDMEPDTLKLELRHNANGDNATTTTSEMMYDYKGLQISSYYMGFDVSGILEEIRQEMKEYNKDIYIDVKYLQKSETTNDEQEAHSGLMLQD
jgi:hypothetical protein